MGLQRQRGRATGLLTAAALSSALLAGGSPYALADDGAARSQDSGALLNAPFDVELSGAPLGAAIRLIKQRTGINIVFVTPNATYNPVDISVTKKPVRQVLQLIAESAGADLWEKDGIFFVGPKGSAPHQEADLTAVPQPATNPAPAPGPVRWEKIKLMYSDPQTILRQLGALLNAPPDFYQQMTNATFRHILSMGKPEWDNSVSPDIKFLSGNGQPTVIPPVPTGNPSAQNINLAPGSRGGAGTGIGGRGGSLNLGGGGSAPDQGAHRDGGDLSAEFGRGGQGFGVGGGSFQPGGGGFQPGGGGQPGGGAGQPGGQGQAGGLLPQGINPGDLFALDADNSIIVRYSDQGALRDLREVIRLLDVKPRQIMIRAEFITVTQNDISAFGINWSFRRVNLVGAANTGFSTDNTAFLQYAAGNFQTQLSWLLTTGRGKIVAAPTATTLNNVPVAFTTTNLVPVFLTTPVISPTGTVFLATQVVPVPAITGLFITPRINGDESLTLFGSAFTSDVGAPIVGPNGEASFPNITNQTAPIQRIIRNGDTMVIAGLLRKRDVVSSNRVPLLGDLPLIGSLFRSRSVTTDDAELLVFITPTIIPERAPNTAGGPGAGGPLAPGGAGPGGGGTMP